MRHNRGWDIGRPTWATAAACWTIALGLLTSCGAAARPASSRLHCGGKPVLCTVAYSHDGHPRIQFEGDSLFARAAPKLAERWGATHDVAIRAWEGTTTLVEAAYVAREARLAPDVAVIELGTNDAACVQLSRPFWCDSVGTFDAKIVTDRLAHFRDEFGARTCVVFVTPDDHNPGWNPAAVRLIDDYERTHFTHVADWQAAYRPDYFDHPDDPHPNAKGQKVLLDVVAAAVTRC
jgi:hypothetical protein